MIKKLNIVTCTMLTIFLFYSCATYYQKSAEFQTDFAMGNLEEAKQFLEKNSKASEKKDRLLYFFDRGVVEQMLGNYDSSNAFFERAYIYNQDFRKNYANDVLEMVANPMLKPYQAEDFEAVILFYYKAINYIHLNQLDNALIEIRRINVQLNKLNDKYEDRKNRYKQDAFALNLMGMVYDAKGEINDAFIAYRNSYEAYREIYEAEFGLSAPEQLKKDLLRTSKQLGFRQEYQMYQKEFNITLDDSDFSKDNGELIVFWMNGLGPVKGEFSLNLTAIKGEGGAITFSNDQEGFSIPYFESNNGSNSSDLSDLKFVRMAIPKYRRRDPLYSSADLIPSDNLSSKVQFEKAEDLQKIAVSTLQDRMFREVAKSVARVAIKQAAEEAARQENDDIGALVSVFNAVTEKADTRNWQTLPNSIYYARIKLKPGLHTLSLNTKGSQDLKQNNEIVVEIKKGKTSFHTFHSLASTALYN